MQEKLYTYQGISICLIRKIFLTFVKRSKEKIHFKLLFLLFLLFQINTSHSQILDSLKAALHQKPGIDLSYEKRNSFLLNDTVRFRGIKLGLRFGKKLKIGLSFNWLKTNLYNQVRYFYNSSNDTTGGFFKMAYFAVYTKIVYHKTQRWEFSTPLQLGYGSSWLQKNPPLSYKHQLFKKNMLVYEPTVAVQFKILKWLGIAGNIGYRFVWHKEEKILSHLNGPIYVLNINFMLEQLFFEMFPDSPITQKYGPAEW